MDKAVRTRGVGRGADVGTCGVARVSQLVMHVEGSVQAELAVVMLGVVPAKEVFAMRAGFFERPKARREIRAILERLELRFRVRIVVRCGFRLMAITRFGRSRSPVSLQADHPVS